MRARAPSASPVPNGAPVGAAAVPAPRWRPVGGALAASIVIHALALASLAAMLVHHDAPPGAFARSEGLTAILTAARSAASSRPEDVDTRVSDAALPVPAPPPRTPSPAPWSAMPVDVSPPPTLFGSAMTSEGVETFETRNLVQLGGAIEARIRRDYPVEPEHPVLLKPPATIGYPIDALAAGVEGSVLVWFGVDEEGKVVDKEALDGPPELMEWVLERIERLVERPALDGGRPVRAWVALEVHFSRESAEAARERAAAAAK